ATVEADTDDRVDRLAALDQLLRDAHDDVGGDREAHTDRAGGGSLPGDLGDGAVDPDDVAGGVQQRSPRVARVDRRIGLDGGDVGLGAGLPRAHRALERRDDAGRHRRAEAEGRTDRHDVVPDDDVLGLADVQGLQALRVDLENGHVVGGVGADDLGVTPGPVGHLDAHPATLAGALHDVVVRDDVPPAVIDPARTGPGAGGTPDTDGDDARHRLLGDGRDRAVRTLVGSLVLAVLDDRRAAAGLTGAGTAHDEAAAQATEYAGEERCHHGDAERPEPPGATATGRRPGDCAPLLRGLLRHRAPGLLGLLLTVGVGLLPTQRLGGRGIAHARGRLVVGHVLARLLGARVLARCGRVRGPWWLLTLVRRAHASDCALPRGAEGHRPRRPSSAGITACRSPDGPPGSRNRRHGAWSRCRPAAGWAPGGRGSHAAVHAPGGCASGPCRA